MVGHVITIRRFEESDIEAAVELESSARQAPWSAGVFADELSQQNRAYLVAVDTGLLAYGGVMVVGEEAHVTNLLVGPDHRRQGLGRALMVALIEESIALGARHLTLEVRQGNEAARGLYKSLGLAPVGIRPGYYGDEDALILWAHDIDAPGFLEALK